MLCQRYYVYVAHDLSEQRMLLGISRRLELTRSFLEARVGRRVGVLTLACPLPLGVADYLVQRLCGEMGILPDNWFSEEPKRRSWIPGRSRDGISRLGSRAGPILSELGYGAAAQILKLPPDEDAVSPPDEVDLHSLENAIRGRALLLGEIPKAIEEARVRLRSPLYDVLEALVLSRRIVRVPAVGLRLPGSAVCNRCGETSRILAYPCASCGNPECFSCLECAPLGEAKLCGAFYLYPAADPPASGKSGNEMSEHTRRAHPVFTFSLTRAQEAASLELEKFVSNGGKGECLLWAACGAGKTEVTFRSIGTALTRGNRVLIASPRRDAVMELCERLSEAFPDESIVALYGGSLGKYRTGRIVIATTHQVMRFYQAFGLMVLDEVDAFPYAGNPMLIRCCRRAVLPGGQVIYLSATPTRELRKEALRGKIGLVKIPARHHGRPIPEPDFLVEEPGEGTVRRVFELLIGSLERSCQVFVFVPRCRLAEEFAVSLKETALPQAAGLPGFQGLIDFSHSRDPRRDTVRRQFKDGRIKVLVSTTIMERSVTVPRADVVVVGADDERVFDENSLVQMAGRAGRSSVYPDARVWFIGGRISPAMRLAKELIHDMNEEARRLGYLQEG